ncbi:MAG: hypothetical protein GY855_09985 [candidate division Zixibacteria bacterium]|nr:hypothetical protein [candidate division Zixibacteria bacterium]
MRTNKQSAFYGKFELFYRAALLILMATALLAASGCSPKKPEAPRWDTKWSVPLTSKTYDIEELLDELDEENLVIDSTGAPRFEFTENVDTFEVGENLTADGNSRDFAEELGLVDIDSPDGQVVETDIDDMLTVNVGVVPPSGFVISNNLDTLEEFSWADVDEGKMYLEISNQLEIDLDTVKVVIIDTFDGSVIDTLEYPNGVAYGEVKTDSVDLAGQTIHNTLRTETTGYTSGGTLLNLGPQVLTTTSSYSNTMTVSAARAIVPEIVKDFSQNIESNDSTIIDSALVETGSLELTLNNKTNLDVNLLITVPSLANSYGQLTISRSMTGNQEITITRDLSNYTLSPTGSSIPQNIPVQVNATIPSSGNSMVTVNQNDSILVSSEISALAFTSITGKIKPTSVDIDPTSVDIDIPDGLDQAALTDANLYLDFYNNSELPADLDLLLTGSNSNTLTIAGRVEGKSAGASSPRLTTISVGSDALSEFLNPPPAGIDITGDAIFSPDYGNGTVAQTDYVYGDLLMTSPLAFSLADTVDIDLDIEEQEISEDAPDFDDRVHYAVVNAEIVSHLPVGAEISIYISTLSDSTMYNDPNAVVIGPMYLNAAEVDSMTGYAAGETSTSFSDSLDAVDVLIFDNESVYIGKKVQLYTAEAGSDVEIRSSDYITINATAITEFEVGGED